MYGYSKNHIIQQRREPGLQLFNLSYGSSSAAAGDHMFNYETNCTLSLI
jgi:hypothetical protein